MLIVLEVLAKNQQLILCLERLLTMHNLNLPYGSSLSYQSTL